MKIHNHIDIDYALVEEKRPPIYTAMKYWGKKPHNIWRKYIETYAKRGGVCLDPFSGSAMGAFETVKSGRKAIAFDINPLTSFIIEVFCSSFNKEKFIEKCENILDMVKDDPIYKDFYLNKCPSCLSDNAFIENFKWENKKIYSVGLNCYKCGRLSIVPDKEAKRKAVLMDNINIPFWYPNEIFYDTPSFGKSFLNKIGGNSFSNIWTKRNLYILSIIFNNILRENSDALKKQLLFGFIQTVHLCSKMCVPRREKAKRNFSTSWGRAAYLCSDRQMEMNPLVVFKRSCINSKQSVISSLGNFEKYIGKIPKLKYVDTSNMRDKSQDWDIKYGMVDINTLTKYIECETIDFILTDPPYGGLVQYLDLSYIWLVWLKKYDVKYTPDIDAEITIKKPVQSIEVYKRKFTNGIKNLYKVLKSDGKIVFTFHNKEIKIWNAFLISLAEAGFQIEKVIHQQNRRTGESNVANPYGTSSSDFYIRCIKSSYVKNIKTAQDEFENFVVDRSEKIIEERGEPTPFQILFNGLLAEISKAGFALENFDCNIHNILSKHIDKEFVISRNSITKSGNFWDIKKKAEKKNSISLSDRVEKSIKLLLNNKVSVSFDEVLAEIFMKYPNGLTPDISKVKSFLEKYAYKSGAKWIYKNS